MKGRLNNMMRDDMQKALLVHAYGAREAALRAEGIELRNEAIHQLLKPAQIKAIETLMPLLHVEGGKYRSNNVNWGSGVSVNCGGPKIEVGDPFGGYSDNYKPIKGALPMLCGFGDQRLDLPADDEFAVRVQDWADRCEEYRSERKVSAQQISAALAAFSTVSQLTASWPEVLPVVESVLIEHLGRPAPSLPAIVITEMNAKLGLPPSNDEAEIAKAA